MTIEEKKEYMKNWREANKEKIKKYNSERNTNSSTKEYRKNATIKYREKNYENFLLLQIKSSAKKRNLEFNLTIEDIIIPKFCKYTNIELTKTIGGGLLNSAPSIDRIDTNKGYIKGNIQIISHLANKMKSNCTINELLTFAENVIKLHK